MATPSEEIQAFLESSEVPPARRSGVAAAFARSMLHELRASVAEWETAAAALQSAEGATGVRDGGKESATE